MCVCVCVCACACVRVCVCACVRVCMCMCVMCMLGVPTCVHVFLYKAHDYTLHVQSRTILTSLGSILVFLPLSTARHLYIYSWVNWNNTE